MVMKKQSCNVKEDYDQARDRSRRHHALPSRRGRIRTGGKVATALPPPPLPHPAVHPPRGRALNAAKQGRHQPFILI